MLPFPPPTHGVHLVRRRMNLCAETGITSPRGSLTSVSSPQAKAFPAKGNT